jgi:hypothetical protein
VDDCCRVTRKGQSCINNFSSTISLDTEAERLYIYTYPAVAFVSWKKTTSDVEPSHLLLTCTNSALLCFRRVVDTNAHDQNSEIKHGVKSSMAATDSGEFATKVSGVISDLDRAITDIRCDDSIHEQDQFHQSVLRDILDRFKLWAGSLGAFHSSLDPRSLEYRLRKAPQVRSRVHDLLAALSGSLHESKSISSTNLN